MSEVIVGKYRGRYLTAKGQEFVLVAAPTGAEKGVAVVLPNLLNFPDSVVVLDIKLENFRLTSRFRARHGQQVFLWAPFAEDGRTHCWNMLDAIDRDSLFRVGQVLAVAQSFYPSDCDPKEKYWNDNARNLFLGLVLYLLETPELPCTLGEVFRLSSGRGRPLKEYLHSLIDTRHDSERPLSDDCLHALGRFLSAPENTLGNIISTFNAPLLVFANPVVDAATSRSDFALADLRRRRISVYVGIQPNRLNDAALLVNMFFTQLIDLNTNELPERDPALIYECLLVLDEVIALGKIGILAKSNPYIRGYGLRLLTIIQSVAQLVSVYGEADARTLITNHAIQIAYAPQEQRDADDYSRMLGTITRQALSRSRNRSFAAGTAGSASETLSEHGRALMLPQELKLLKPHQQIVFLKNTRPILCEKARYYEDHRFLDRLKSISPSLARLDHTPWRRNLRRLGAVNLARATPTQAQIKHAAFVLKELSIDVPALGLRPARPAPATTRPPPPPMPATTAAKPAAPAATLPPIRLNAASFAALPLFADQEHPSKAEAVAVAKAFMDQLTAIRDDAALTSAPTAAQPPGPPTGPRQGPALSPAPAGGSDATRAAGHSPDGEPPSNTGPLTSGPRIDLSALDRQP